MRKYLGLVTIGLYVVILFAASFGVLIYYTAFLGVNSNAYQDEIIIWTNTVYYGSLFVLYIALFLHMWKTQIKAFVTRLRLNILYIVIGIAVIFVTSFSVNFIYSLINVTDQAQNQTLWEDLLEIGDYAIVLIGLATVLFAPMVEEVVFRLSGFWLIKKFKMSEKAFPYVSIGVTSFFFGLIHVVGDDFIQILYYMLLGVVLGFFYFKSKNILVPIAIHMVWNALSFIVMITSM